MSPKRILLSNDDGIDAPGLHALQEGLAELGEIWVVAPDRERSATSHAISLHQPLRMIQRGERSFAVDGTPTDCVYLALNHLMPQQPDIVVSGINLGPNLGNDVHYSGTVSAAMEGALFGHPAIAISLCLPDDFQERSTLHFESAAHVAESLTRSVLAKAMPPGVLLNVNVPNRPREELRSAKLCRLGYTDWADAVTKRRDPRGRDYWWIGGDRNGHDEIPDSDNNGVAAGHVTITPIHYDLTDYHSFAYTRALALDGLSFVDDGLGNGPLSHPIHPRARR